MLPLYPAITALLLLALINGGIDRWRRGAVATACLVVIVPLGLMAVLIGGNWRLDNAVPWLALPLFVLVLIAGISVVAAFRRLDLEGALWRCVIASLLLTFAVYPFAIESLRSLKISPRLAEAARSVGCADPAVMTLGYREPSLVFLTGTDLAMAPSGAEAANFLNQPGCRIAFVESRFADEFQKALAALPAKPRLVTTIDGFNLNGGSCSPSPSTPGRRGRAPEGAIPMTSGLLPKSAFSFAARCFRGMPEPFPG